MAKRRRLEVSEHPAPAPGATSITRLSGAPPIADIAGQAAALSAAEGAVAEIAAAREDGRLVIRVALDVIDPDHLVRDRVLTDDEDMAALRASIATHGQRMPVELVDQGNGRYGLISGWRRISALAALHKETGEPDYGTVLAILRKPGDAGAAYIAMVEENEIRVGLSYYERARIAAKAAERGAFADTEAAINALYAAGSKARRSKIRAFVLIHEVLGAALAFPAHLSERLGLRLVQAIRQGRAPSVLAALDRGSDSPEAEAALLEAALRRGAKAGQTTAKTTGDKAEAAPTRRILAPGLVLEARKSATGQVLTLSGARVDSELADRIATFLREG